MNIFRQSNLSDDEEIQASRLDDALDAVLSGNQTDFDSREDPELTELIEMGKLLHSSGEETTSRLSFHSFHMRSRSAILHATGERVAETEQLGTGVGRFLRTFIPNRSAILPAFLASVASVAFFVIGIDGQSNESVVDVPLDEVVTKNAEVDDAVALRKTTVSLNMGLDVSPTLSEIQPDTQSSEPAAAVQFTGATSVEAVVQSTGDIFSAAVNGDRISQETLSVMANHLALLGADIRLGYNSDTDYQEVVAAALLALQIVEPAGDSVSSSLLVARLVAQDTMSEALDQGAIQTSVLDTYGLMVARLDNKITEGTALNKSSIDEVLQFSERIADNLRAQPEDISLADMRKYQKDLGSLIQALDRIGVRETGYLEQLSMADQDFVFATKQVLGGELVQR